MAPAEARQLPLTLSPPGTASFESFRSGDNGVTVAALQRIAAGEEVGLLRLEGPSGSGKSHLLQATCQRAWDAGLSAQRVPLASLGEHRAEALVGLEALDLVCLDDLSVAFADAQVEYALFKLYNGLRDRGGSLVVGLAGPLASHPIGLPDLRSRLAAMTLVSLVPLPESERRVLMEQEAERRGLHLSERALDYLFRHGQRHLGRLLETLDQLDRLSLAHQRRISVALVRDALQSAGASPDASGSNEADPSKL